jgi:hypothetical protein
VGAVGPRGGREEGARSRRGREKSAFLIDFGNPAALIHTDGETERGGRQERKTDGEKERRDTQTEEWEGREEGT